MTAILLAILCGADPEGISYSTADVPTRYQSENGWRALGQHPNSNQPSSNPNQRYPWKVPAGTSYVDDLSARRWIKVPDGEKVRVWSRKVSSERAGSYSFGSGSHRHYYWRFPIGTTLTERLYYRGKAFVERSRSKVAEDRWENNEDFLDDPPPGYGLRPQTVRRNGRNVVIRTMETRSCIDCHKDAGLHVSRLPNSGGDWYDYLRGGRKEEGRSTTVFSFCPIDDQGRPLARFAKIVEFVRSD